MTLLEYIRSGASDITTLAYAIGVSPHAVHKWAYGQREPDIETAGKIERATNGAVTVMELSKAAVEAAKGKAA